MAAPIITKGSKVVPTVWTEQILKRDFEIVLGKMLQSEQYDVSETEEPYLRSANIQWEGVDITDVKTMWLSPQEKRDLLLRANDLVVNEGGDVGRCASWNGEIEECYFQNSVNRVRPRRCSSGRFLYYWLNNIKSAGFIDAIVSRTTIAHLTAEKLEALPWPKVPHREQQRIATYLDESCSAIDAAVAGKQRQIETLDGVRRDIIQKAVTRGLEMSPSLKQTGNVWMPQVPSNWELVSLKRISEIQTGLTLGKVYEGPLVERPYLRVANVQDGHLKLAAVTTIEVPKQVARRVTLRAGDVLMTEGGDLDKLGRGTIWNGEIADCLHQNHIFAIRCFRHKLLPSFLAYLTASRYGRDYFEATGKRTTNLASTSSTKVGMFPIPRPPLGDQERICTFLDDKLTEISRIQRSIETQSETLTAYRKSLIHECVTGQRRITEADIRRLKDNINIDVA